MEYKSAAEIFGRFLTLKEKCQAKSIFLHIFNFEIRHKTLYFFEHILQQYINNTLKHEIKTMKLSIDLFGLD
jgi:hypothetical protein